MQNCNNFQIHIETLGCRLNQIESESIAAAFIKEQFTVSMESITSNSLENKEVLLCIINTCTVTQKAEQKARRIIRLFLKKYSNAIVIVTGCYAQLAASQIEKMDKRICAVGGQIKSRLADLPLLLRDFFNENEKWSYQAFLEVIRQKISVPAQITAFKPENSFRLATSSFLAHSRASLKIQDGCNSNCSYCAIHIARGKSVSIDVPLALERVRELEEKGNEEVVITTVNISQYKSEYDGKIYDFTALLEYLLENTKTINFRISSLYPQVVDDKFCRVIANPRVRPHFHISVQSGSNTILALMNRAYKADDVRMACKMLRQARPDCFLACDIITGFPGESDEDFLQTMQLLSDCDFTWVHAFPFSERPGTPACSLKNKVPQSISGERSKKINEWAVENKILYLQKMIGNKYSAILENARRPSVFGSSVFIYHAVTENFIHCEIQSSENLPLGKSITIEITGILSDRIKKGGESEVSAKIVSD